MDLTPRYTLKAAIDYSMNFLENVVTVVKRGYKASSTQKNFIYRMDCKLRAKDESFYVGETRHSVRLRHNEHIRDAKKNSKHTLFSAFIRPNARVCSWTVATSPSKSYTFPRTAQIGRSGSLFSFVI